MLKNIALWILRGAGAELEKRIRLLDITAALSVVFFVSLKLYDHH